METPVPKSATVITDDRSPFDFDKFLLAKKNTKSSHLRLAEIAEDSETTINNPTKKGLLYICYHICV